MPATSNNSISHHAKSSVSLLIALGFVVILIVAGAAYGVARMQRGLDALYEPHLPQTSPFLAGPASPNDPPIIIVGNRVHGRELFNMSCYVCHGPTGAGVPALGANLRQSRFIRTHTDQQLITFIKMGRQPGDPNTIFNGTMPPKGGNPMLDDAGLQDVVAFLRSLQSEALGRAIGDASTSTASTSR